MKEFGGVFLETERAWFRREEDRVVLLDFLEEGLFHPPLVSSVESARRFVHLLHFRLGECSSLDKLLLGVSKGKRHSWSLLFITSSRRLLLGEGARALDIQVNYTVCENSDLPSLWKSFTAVSLRMFPGSAGKNTE